MPNPSEGGRASLNQPRSPEGSSTDSSRRGSLKAPHGHKELAPPTPVSPPTRLTRKRAASLDVESVNQPRIGDLALSSASTTGPPTSDSTREQVCLCQPDPKIPRPRNAFILYRQHYQAQVVAQNPGLANPEISKIIGEKWREQAPEVKSDWKRLAEEEKQRHQRQYPGYRYQPRRAGKINGIHPASSSSADGPVRCPKCNGRYISTPSTPLTPFTPAFATRAPSNDRLLPAFTPSRPLEVERPRIDPYMQAPRVDSPRLAPPHQQAHHRPQYPPPRPLHTHHERDEEMDLLSPSPDQKRRRFNDGQRFSMSSPSFPPPQQFGRNGPPMSATGYRQHLPGPGMIVRPGTGQMGPPPQQSPMHQSRHHYPTRSATFDESLRLPPLQTQMPPTPTSQQRPEHRADSRASSREIQARSIEAMVMTIPYINKIKVLTKICPPLAPPTPGSPAQEIRGTIIAVEGPDKALLADIGAFITESLYTDPSCALKVWETSSASSGESAAENSSVTDTEMTDEPAPRKSSSAETEEGDPFVDYLSIISDMHKKSNSITKYITTLPAPETAISPTTTPQNQSILPIALFPTGFSLTTSDKYALRIPINDSYAPVDHWQWMATLWRGIVGPDLTIYVTRVGKEEWGKMGGVEIRSDCGAIVVRVAEGQQGMDEKSSRRLRFEVLEWVRNAEGVFGRS